MKDTADIKVRHISKVYKLGQREQYKTIRDAIVEKINFAKKFNSYKNPNLRASNEFWALKDVTFDVNKGEVLGIIGKNGAGKSTLLKILSRITYPSEGEVEIHGRVGSLLEVGTGFHPELTGKENVYLSGSILGMKKIEIDNKFEEIIKFSELEKFIDTPVKRYSSGMYVRLAFAVAAHLEPEILIVDEVLAVGDSAFQKKCLGKMGEVSKEGRTILFVSHNMSAVENLCDTGIVLTNGMAGQKVDISDAIMEYSKQINVYDDTSLPLVNDDLSIIDFELLQDGINLTEFDGGKPIEIRINFELLHDLTHFRIGIFIKSVNGELISRSLIADWDGTYSFLTKGLYSVTGTIPSNFLVSGEYYFQMHGSRYGITDYLLENHISKLVLIRSPVQFNPSYISERSFGMVLINPHWNVKKISQDIEH
jgi:lipopolysaccharide transport system ATP-binding protein